jgi:hypothetical protein
MGTRTSEESSETTVSICHCSAVAMAPYSVSDFISKREMARRRTQRKSPKPDQFLLLVVVGVVSLTIGLMADCAMESLSRFPLCFYRLATPMPNQHYLTIV